MTAPHTGSLNAAILAAVHTAVVHADEVDFSVVIRDHTGRPTLFRVTVWRENRHWAAEGVTPDSAMAAAMFMLRLALAGA